MKKLTLVLVLVVSLISFSFTKKSKQYCGEVKEMYIKDPEGKSKEYHVIFYCEDLRKNVDAVVKRSVYKNTNPKGSICVELSRKQVR